MGDESLVTTEGVDEAPEPTPRPEPVGPGGTPPVDDPDVAPPVPLGSEPLGPGQELEEGEG